MFTNTTDIAANTAGRSGFRDFQFSRTSRTLFERFGRKVWKWSALSHPAAVISTGEKKMELPAGYHDIDSPKTQGKDFVGCKPSPRRSVLHSLMITWTLKQRECAPNILRLIHTVFEEIKTGLWLKLFLQFSNIANWTQGIYANNCYALLFLLYRVPVYISEVVFIRPCYVPDGLRPSVMRTTSEYHGPAT